MTPEQLIKVFSTLCIWKRDGERAPHKPLLLLLALAGVDRKEPRLHPFAEIKDKLKYLLMEFGPPRKIYRPSYPFIRLQNDGIWEVTGNKILDPRRDWSNNALLENKTFGGFTQEIYSMLLGDRKLIRELATIILEQNFPETIYEDILNAVGIEADVLVKSTRDPQFRERILRAYEYSCAVCGFNVRLGQTLVAVEAAHIKWHQAGGPDTEQNGIALCTMHHKLFDRGVFTLTESMTLQVAEAAHGTRGFDEWVMRYHGKKIRNPQSPIYKPEEPFIKWHVQEVFRGPARYMVEDL